MNGKGNVKVIKKNATSLTVRSLGCWGVHLVTVSDGFVDATILRLGGNGIELKVMLKPAMLDENSACLRQVMLALGMRNIGPVFFALKLKPVRRSARLKRGFVQPSNSPRLLKRWVTSGRS